MTNTRNAIAGRKVAILVANHIDAAVIHAVRKALESGAATVKILAPQLGEIKSDEGHNYKGQNGGKLIKVDHSFAKISSILLDAVFIPGGQLSAQALCQDANAVLFLKEAYLHGKAIAASDEGVMLLTQAAGKLQFQEQGVITSAGNAVDKAFIQHFVEAVAQHRFTERMDLELVVANVLAEIM
ncbi:MAG: DJ-1/PfpI family protein [Methylotenera sp.]